ncbi:MAG TPA: acyl-CoA dehydrogenase family protein [Acidimicrobiales bacterium]|nr:acyl-CoA dehydrogenase family protein [Acidimicrobiales bacterium]
MAAAEERTFVTGLPAGELTARARQWVEAQVPEAWRRAAGAGGASAIRQVRPRADYEAWYPVFAASGLVAPTWPVEYGGAGLTPSEARSVEVELAPYNLGRLNPLGLSLAAPALFAFGTEEQRLRYLPPIVRNQEVWCQLFSEPGAGSDLASLATRAERDADEWVITGQKVWNTWAHLADFGVLLARTDVDAPKRQGITYFLIGMDEPGVEVRPLRHITGEIDFNEVFLDGARIPDGQRVGEVNAGWKVANATLSGERQMVSGSGSGGVDRIGGGGAERLVHLARRISAGGHPGGWDDPGVRQKLMAVLSEERIRNWTNQRVRAGIKAGRSPGPESSVGKVHQGDLNQRMQVLATDLLGADAVGWSIGADAVAASGAAGPGERYAASLPYEVKGMLRSRANTIEGGTTEVNKNIIAERVLGLPREPDPWQTSPWREVPRS